MVPIRQQPTAGGEVKAYRPFEERRPGMRPPQPARATLPGLPLRSPHGNAQRFEQDHSDAHATATVCHACAYSPALSTSSRKVARRITAATDRPRAFAYRRRSASSDRDQRTCVRSDRRPETAPRRRRAWDEGRGTTIAARAIPYRRGTGGMSTDRAGSAGRRRDTTAEQEVQPGEGGSRRRPWGPPALSETWLHSGIPRIWR